MIRFGTLGPVVSNHDWVAHEYLKKHKLIQAEVVLFTDFDLAFAALLDGRLDYVLQVAVHPSVAATVARYRNRLHLVDTFISPSQAMAVVSRRDAEDRSTIGLQPATRDYIDVSQWSHVVPEPSTVDVSEGLLNGKYGSGITLVRFVDEYPDLLEIDEMIGTVVDPWLVYGRQPVACDGPVIWTDSPAAEQYKAFKD